jgi:hypothetical protein
MATLMADEAMYTDGADDLIMGSEEARRQNLSRLGDMRVRVASTRLVAMAHDGYRELVDNAPNIAADLVANSMVDPTDAEEAKRLALAVMVTIAHAESAMRQGVPFNLVMALMELAADDLISNAEAATRENVNGTEPTDGH